MREIIRKLSLSAGCIALIAFMLPALASATELQSEAGEPLLVGYPVLAESHDMELHNTQWGKRSCEKAVEKLRLDENSGDVLLSGRQNESYVSSCELGDIEKFTMVTIQIAEPGTGTIGVSFDWHIGPLHCHFEGEGTFSYETGTSVFELEEVPLEGDEVCEPGAGQMTLSGHFSLSDWYGWGEESVLIVDHAPEWGIQSTPGSVSGGLFDVSCASMSECIAVGSKVGSEALAERWDGSEWTTMPGPGGDPLQAVSCTSAMFCVAISSEVEAQRWNGSKWSAITPPTPAEATDAHLRGVSCASSSSCMAVGSYVLGGKVHALVERYDGKGWTILATPAEDGTQLDVVSCEFLCTVIGHKGGEAVALRWNGGWSTMAPPKYTGSDISCTFASACMKVGGEGAERWDGSEWVSTMVPKPEGARYVELKAVSCRPPECIATGYYVYESENEEFSSPLAARWNGSEWVLQEAVDPGAEHARLMGVSCSSANRCTAVGVVLDDGAVTPLAERYQ